MALALLESKLSTPQSFIGHRDAQVIFLTNSFFLYQDQANHVCIKLPINFIGSGQTGNMNFVTD